VAPPTAPKTDKNEERKITGIATGATYGSSDDVEDSPTATNEAKAAPSNNGFSNSWKLNVVLALISCWFAMAVTSWGSIDTGGDRANPEVGKVSMWMLIASQWLFMVLYLWTLVAPRLFPDRDFS
jgi:serine incorporator 1/3